MRAFIDFSMRAAFSLAAAYTFGVLTGVPVWVVIPAGVVLGVWR